MSCPSCDAWSVLTPERRTNPIRILIADDEANIRRILETRLRLAGFEVAAAVNGMQALELFRSFEPDALVLDVMMPELDGFGVTSGSGLNQKCRLFCSLLWVM